MSVLELNLGWVDREVFEGVGVKLGTKQGHWS